MQQLLKFVPLRAARAAYFLLIALSLTNLPAKGQSVDEFAKAIDFLPPPPNASAIIKNNLISINKNTGSPNVSIPFPAIAGIKLSIGMSLGYSSTGIKVDELASRTGMGWALNAGGVVTRIIRGSADELNTRLAPPATFSTNCETFNYLKKVNEGNEGLRFIDTEPDQFNFNMNGISGGFVLNANMQPVTISAEKLKITIDFSATAPWNFKIITTDGLTYYFGGVSAVEKTKRESSCGRNYNAYLPSSWYLKKIEHPNGEVILLTYTSISYSYETGVSETMEWIYPVVDYNLYDPNQYSSTACPSCPAVSTPRKCVNRVNTQGVILSRIASNTNRWVDLSYGTRSDCNDKLLSELRYYTNEGLFGSYSFLYDHQAANMSFANEVVVGHDKTPYLISLTEYSSASAKIGEHRFTYNDPAARPPRLSFSQDHWGYFNGARNYSTFVPKPLDASLIQKFPYATANREADEVFAAKGMLSKIVYPGGGIDNLIYESNTIPTNVATPTLHVLNAQVTGIGLKEPASKSVNFTISTTQNVELQIFCAANGIVDDLHHNTGFVELYSSGWVRHSQQVINGYSASVIYELAPGYYTLTVKANGTIITTRAAVKYYPTAPAAQPTNKVVGGVRVKYLLTGSPGHQSFVKRFYYGEIETPEISSLGTQPPKFYARDIKKSLPCQVVGGGGGGGPGPSTAFCTGKSIYSSSLSNLYDYGGAPVSYSSVIESQGDGFDNGCIQTKFFTKPDAPGVILWGNDITGATMSNFSAFLNGKEKEEIVYKKTKLGTIVPLKKTTHTYSFDAQDQNIISGIAVEKLYELFIPIPGESCPPATSVLPVLVNSFNAVRYDMMSYWVHKDSQTDIMYDEAGLNPVTNQSLFTYGNSLHHNLTRTTTTNSKGEIIATEYKYPHDFSGQPVYASMVSKNMIDKVIEMNTYTNGTKTTTNKINYSDWGNGNIGISTVQKAFKDGILKQEASIDLTDIKGRTLQYTGKDGIVKAVIWGGDQCQYPVANIIGATYNQAISYLTVPPANFCTLDDNTLKTQVNLIRSGLPNAKIETYTYKAKPGVTSKTDINNFNTSYSYDDRDRLSLINNPDGHILKKFDYYIDPSVNADLKLFYNPAVSQTFNCQTCLGGYTAPPVTYTIPDNACFSTVSIEDAKAKAMKMLLIKGQAYANSATMCTFGALVYKNAPTSGLFTRNNCNPGYIGSEVSFDMPLGACTGPTQYDADALARYRIATEGQAYANVNGVCNSACTPVNCTGENKLCVAGFCLAGVKIFTSSTQVHGSLWQCIYHYEWSDGTWSPNYTEYASSRCLNEF